MSGPPQPKPTLTLLPLHHPSPTPPPEHFVHLIHNLLTPTECSSLISSHQNLIPSNVTSGAKRDREAFDDAALAELLWSRLEPFYGDSSIPSDSSVHSSARIHSSAPHSLVRIQYPDGQWWRATGLNERFRLCRYEKGGKFSAHCDGRFMRSVDEQSWMTVNCYLNDVPVEWRGATRVLLDGSDGEGEEGVLGKVQPMMGMAAVFRDCLWHDGEELVCGVKYLLRTDIMYEREVPFDFERISGGLDDEEKGRQALALAEGLEDAGNREEAVRWYKKAFKLAPALERSGG